MTRGGRGSSSLTVGFMDTLMGWTVSGLKLALLAFVISTGYILYGVFGGHLADAVEPRVIDNLRLMGQIMAGSGVIAAICLVILTHEELAYAVVAGLVGLGLMLGLPILVAGQVSQQAAAAGNVISNWAATTGQGIIAIVGFRIAWEIVIFIRDAPARREQIEADQGLDKQKTVMGRPIHRLSRCWEMPYCHEAIKESCPAFSRRKNCWRIQQGCNCDPYLIETLLKRGAGLNVLPDQGSEYVRSDLTDKQRKAGTERTLECRRCPIFNEHQRQKFQLLNPILVAASIALLVAAYPIMQKLYQTVIGGAARLAERLAYGSYVPVGEWINRLDSPAVWYFFYIIIGLLMLSYVLKAIEWAVLKAKIL